MNLDIKKDRGIDKRVPISIEFYGLPGCGKSTVSHMLAECLREKGYAVNEPTYVLDHQYSKVGRRIKKVWLSCLYLMADYSSFRAIVHSISTSKGKVSLQEIINLIPKCRNYCNSESYDVLVWDEGILQSAVSSLVDSNPQASGVLAEKLLRVVADNSHLVGIYMDIPITLAMERMKERNTKDSRADRLEEKEKLEFLQGFQEGLSSLNYDIHITDYKKQAEEMVQIITEQILKKKS